MPCCKLALDQPRDFLCMDKGRTLISDQRSTTEEKKIPIAAPTPLCRGSKTERKEVSKCPSHDLLHFRNIFNTAREKQQQNPGILFLPWLSSCSLLYPALDFSLEKEGAGPGLEKPPCAQQRPLWDHPEAGAGTRPPFPASQPSAMAGTLRALVHPPASCSRNMDPAASQEIQDWIP